jgi:hypothetical protein
LIPNDQRVFIRIGRIGTMLFQILHGSGYLICIPQLGGCIKPNPFQLHGAVTAVLRHNPADGFQGFLWTTQIAIELPKVDQLADVARVILE